MLLEKTTSIKTLFNTLQNTEYTFEQKLSKIAKQIEDFNDDMTNKQEQLHRQLSSTTEKETKIFKMNLQTIFTTMTDEAKQQATKISRDIKLHVEQHS
jgi:hypothetical protein